MTVRPIGELIHTDNPAWPELVEKFSRAAVSVDVLPVSTQHARDALFRLQVTTRSVLGALVLHTGGLVVDSGWLRILGGGYADLPDVASVNRIERPGQDHGSLVVAVDALGGMFAVNGGVLPGELGGICYFGADTLRWDPIGGKHSTFVDWALDGGMDDFYADLRWNGWADEIDNLPPDQGLSMYPPLWSAEGSSNIAANSRCACPLIELAAQHLDAGKQLDG